MFVAITVSELFDLRIVGVFFSFGLFCRVPPSRVLEQYLVTIVEDTRIVLVDIVVRFTYLASDYTRTVITCFAYSRSRRLCRSRLRCECKLLYENQYQLVDVGVLYTRRRQYVRKIFGRA
jgi:hypothetical protein